MRTFGVLALMLTLACKGGGDKDTDPADTDSDTDTPTLVDADNDGVNSDLDCDDDNPAVFPGNTEICDGIDNDCDDLVDDDDDSLDETGTTEFFADMDSDGVGDASVGSFCEAPPDAVDISGDCDDDDAERFPGNTEVCDGIDNDCDDLADDDDDDLDEASATTWFTDADEDGFGDPDSQFRTCEAPEGTVGNADDCDDAEPLAWTDAPEVCDGVDNDCSGAADDDDPDLDLSTAVTYYEDADEDGSGSAISFVQTCVQPAGYLTTADDCNDTNADVYPGAPEVCDGIDNNCDAATGFLVDGDDPAVDYTGEPTYYTDADADSFGDPATAFQTCEPPADAVTNDGDCNDAEPLAWTGAPEVCDGVDNDCANGADDADPNVDYTGEPTYYTDADGDGFGNGPGFQTCAPAATDVTVDGDCAGGDPDINPGALEVCDGDDNDCDGTVDGLDSWWNPAWPYRMEITLTAPTSDTEGAPVAMDVDFAGELAALGDTSGLAPDSIRVVNQDCALGQPEVPSEFIDGVSGIFEAAPIDDPVGDGFGALTFHYDEDGDTLTRDVFLGEETATFAVYFGSQANASAVPAPLYPTGLLATTDGAVTELSNDLTYSIYQQSSGGLAFEMAPQGRDGRVGSQVDMLAGADVVGNGILFNQPGGGGGPGSGWVPASDDTAANLSVVHAGPTFAAVRTEGSVGNSFGGYDYKYTYMMFDGRPEVYAKVEYVINQPSNIGPQGAPFWTASVRPIQIDNRVLVNCCNGAEGSKAVPDYDWVRGTYAVQSPTPLGVGLHYVQSPVVRGNPVLVGDGDFIGLVGQDFLSPALTDEIAVDAGDVIVDHTLISMYTHEGQFADVSDDFDGSAETIGVTYGAAESHPTLLP